MPTLFPASLRCRHLACLFGSAMLLSACNIDLESTPEPTATATAVTFGPDDVAVETLLNQGSDAWEGVESWESTTRIETAASAPDESADTSSSTERVQPPNRRYVLTTNAETVVSEEISLDGVVYMRGTLISSSIYPDAEPEEWISFTPDQVPEDTLLEQRTLYLTSAPPYPFADVTAETRRLPASPTDPVEVEDRGCEAWEFTSEVADGEGITYVLAFDEQDRPCQLVREGGGVIETTEWLYPEDPAPIAPPQDATPVQEFPTEPT